MTGAGGTGGCAVEGLGHHLSLRQKFGRLD